MAWDSSGFSWDYPDIHCRHAYGGGAIQYIPCPNGPCVVLHSQRSTIVQSAILRVACKVANPVPSLRFGWLVRQTAEVENDMNSVERITHYATEIEQEAPHEVSNKKPPGEWPAHGRVELKDVFLNYRPGLPPVLKGISMAVEAGEKIGIVGRCDCIIFVPYMY